MSVFVVSLNILDFDMCHVSGTWYILADSIHGLTSNREVRRGVPSLKVGTISEVKIAKTALR